MSEPVFTIDYFTHNIPKWTIILEYLNKTFGPNLDCLEVGTFEGRSALYLLDHFVGNGNLTVIDKFYFPGATNKYFQNIANHEKNKQIKTISGESLVELANLYKQEAQFDFIYIDAGKTAVENISSLIIAERILKIGGIVVIDDYGWDKLPDPRYCPKLGIDKFTEITVLSEIFMKGYQMAFKKIKHNDELIAHKK
jgi:predicted O-methyltransferase YrrM